MTVEHITLIDPTDLRAMRIVCAKCRVALSLQLNETINVPAQCPVCGLIWRSHDFHGAQTAADALGTALKQWLTSEQQKNQPYTIRFEVITTHP